MKKQKSRVESFILPNCGLEGEECWFNNNFFNLTPFQVEHIVKMSRSPQFLYYLLPQVYLMGSPQKKKRKVGPIVVPYMTTAGIAAKRIGVREVLGELKSQW